MSKMWEQLYPALSMLIALIRRYWRHILAAFPVIIMGFISARVL